MLQSFARYAAANGVLTCDAVHSSLCTGFVNAAVPRHGAPMAATRRFRLTVVRETFRVLNGVCAVAENPADGLSIETEVGERPRTQVPLTPSEVGRIRASGRMNAQDTLRPAAVTAALLGASHREIFELVVAHVDLDHAQIHLGAARKNSRRLPLDENDMLALQARMAAQEHSWRRRGLDWRPNTVPLASRSEASEYPSASIAPTVSTNLSRALHRAGVARRGVRPRSLREYAANRTYALTERVEEVARVLGLSSLDTAMTFIDPGWQAKWAVVVRADAGD